MEEIKTCHILYVGGSAAGRPEQILGVLKGKPALPVSDIEYAAVHGAVIRFVSEQNRIRFRINLDAARQARIVLSSKLLRVAEVIRSEKK